IHGLPTRPHCSRLSLSAVLVAPAPPLILTAVNLAPTGWILPSANDSFLYSCQDGSRRSMGSALDLPKAPADWEEAIPRGRCLWQGNAQTDRIKSPYCGRCLAYFEIRRDANQWRYFRHLCFRWKG